MRFRAAARGPSDEECGALDAERKIEERLTTAHAGAQTRKRGMEGGGFSREALGSLARDLDDPSDNDLCRPCGEHLWTCRLDLHQSQAGEFLHRQVDFRGRHGALTTQRARVGDPTEHEGHQRFSFVERQANVCEVIGIRQMGRWTSAPSSLARPA